MTFEDISYRASSGLPFFHSKEKKASRFVAFKYLSDMNLARFPNQGWPAVEYWAEQGLLKPDVCGSKAY